MIAHLVANYCRLFLAGKGEEKCTHWRKALQEAKSDKVPQAYLQMQSMKQNFNELCHVIWRVMSCKSLCQLQWLGTKSFSFKINKRVLSSALPQSGTLGKKEVVIGMPCLQITAARLPSVSYNPPAHPFYLNPDFRPRVSKRQLGNQTTLCLRDACPYKVTTKGWSDSNSSSKYFRSCIEFNCWCGPLWGSKALDIWSSWFTKIRGVDGLFGD